VAFIWKNYNLWPRRGTSGWDEGAELVLAVEESIRLERGRLGACSAQTHFHRFISFLLRSEPARGSFKGLKKST
jgi:hypothetical protein